MAKDAPSAATLTRGLEILRCFSRTRMVLGGSDIARITGFSQPTVWRLCQTLLKEGYLVAIGSGGKFRLDISVLALGFSALEGLPLAELALTPLEALSKRFQAAASLTTRDRLSMMFVQRSDVDGILTLNVRAGSRVPMIETTTGWAYLAGLSSDERTVLMAELERDAPEIWKTRAPLIASAIEEFEKTGVVIGEGSFVPTLHTVAAPLRAVVDGHRYVVSCSGPSTQLPSSVLHEELTTAVLELRDALDAALPHHSG